MAELKQRNQITDAYHAISGQMFAFAGNSASQKFLSLGSWRDDDIDTYINEVEPILNQAKSKVANASVAYYKQIAEIEKQPFKNPKVGQSDLTTEALRNGATTKQVWQRPFKEMRMELSRGANFSDALNAGAKRADDLARTEVELARRNAGLKARKSNDRIIGYIRTLSGAENCALCYVASTQRYHKGDLLPIHPGCDCGEMPIYGTSDIGQVIDEERLNATHQAVNDRFGRFDVSARDIDYRKIQIQDHGELGPVLTVKGQNFIGPKQIEKAIKTGKPTKKLEPIQPTTFAEKINPQISAIDRTKIANDIADEHGATRVMGLKGKAKVQTLGEKTSAHLQSIKDVGKQIDDEISLRVNAEIKSISSPKVVKATQEAIDAGENYLKTTQLKFEAGYQDLVGKELAKVNAEIDFKYKGMVSRNVNQDFLDEWLGQYTEEKRLRLATQNATALFKNSPAGQKLVKEIKEIETDLVKLRSELPANMIPGNVKYNQIYADKAKEVLSEIRAVGEGGPKFIGNAKANEVLEMARKVYPSDWLKVASDTLESVNTKSTARGHWNKWAKEIAISFGKSNGFPPGYATAVHEMGHMFEHTVSGIKELEFAFAHQRAALNPKRTKLGSSRETGFADYWRNLYTGKDYGYEVDSSYEIFTTGAESLFSGSNAWIAETNRLSTYYNPVAGADSKIDDEFRQFVLGILGSL